MTDHKCGYCRKPIIRRDGERLFSFKIRQHCDKQCAYAARSVKMTKIPPCDGRKCVQCGKPLVKNKTENRGKFKRRKTCNITCWMTYRSGGTENKSRRKVKVRAPHVVHKLLDRFLSSKVPV